MDELAVCSNAAGLRLGLQGLQSPFHTLEEDADHRLDYCRLFSRLFHFLDGDCWSGWLFPTGIANGGGAVASSTEQFTPLGFISHDPGIST